jgi:hypothetical protein
MAANEDWISRSRHRDIVETQRWQRYSRHRPPPHPQTRRHHTHRPAATTPTDPPPPHPQTRRHHTHRPAATTPTNPPPPHPQTRRHHTHKPAATTPTNPPPPHPQTRRHHTHRPAATTPTDPPPPHPQTRRHHTHRPGSATGASDGAGPPPRSDVLQASTLQSGRTGDDQVAKRPLKVAARPAARSSLGLLSAAVTSYRHDAVRTMRWSIVAT